jgi:serine/threonine protein kinase
MSDMRTPLKSGRPLILGGTDTLSGTEYTILGKPIGYGGSCLVYKAEKHSTPPHKVIIKEFYPTDYAKYFTRNEDDGSLTYTHSVSAIVNLIEDEKTNFKNGVNEQVAFYEKDSNHRLGSMPEYLEVKHEPNDAAHYTIYSVLDLVGGKTLDEKRSDDLSLCDIAQIMQSLCNAVGVLHGSGKLYLDIKPENIFVFEKDVSYRIGLFDFDTVLDNNLEALSGSIQPFSQDWCAPEQKPWQPKMISTATDVFAIGAVFYWLITGKDTKDITYNTNISLNNFSNSFNWDENPQGISNVIKVISRMICRRDYDDICVASKAIEVATDYLRDKKYLLSKNDLVSFTSKIKNVIFELFAIKIINRMQSCIFDFFFQYA